MECKFVVGMDPNFESLLEPDDTLLSICLDLQVSASEFATAAALVSQ